MRGLIGIGVVCVAACGRGAEPAKQAAKPTAKELVAEAWTAAGEVKDVREREDALKFVALAQALYGNLEESKKIIASFTDAGRKSFAYGVLASVLLELGQLEDAVKLIDLISDDICRDGACREIARAQAAKGDVAGVKETMGKWPPKFARFGAHVPIAAAQVNAGDLAGAHETLKSMGEDEKVQGYAHVAGMLAKRGDKQGFREMMDAARENAAKLPGYKQGDALGAIAHAELAAGNSAAAKAIANSVIDPSQKERVLRYLEPAKQEEAPKDVASMQAALDNVRDSTDKALIAARLAEMQAKAGNMEAARNSIKLAKNYARGLYEAKDRALASSEIGAAEVRIGDWAAALQWARSQNDAQAKARALLGIASAMEEKNAPQTGELKK